MDQSMLKEESDGTWMFSGSSDEDEDGLCGIESVIPFILHVLYKPDIKY